MCTEVELARAKAKAMTAAGALVPVKFFVIRVVCGVTQRKSALASVGVWDQLHCFFSLNSRRQAGARPELRRETPRKKETVELLPQG